MCSTAKGRTPGVCTGQEGTFSPEQHLLLAAGKAVAGPGGHGAPALMPQAHG